ncbi:MAG TPA: IS110 family transposase [Lacipirellulaceae bacterium]
MRFYKGQHAFYCGVDLHAKTMHVCLVNQAGEVLVHRNLPTRPDRFLSAIAPYSSQDLVVGVECMFTWYWLADLCAEHNLPFVLGHALYMKAIHGGKTKNDRVDSEKIAMLLRGGMLPEAYAYPHKMRATRDLLRRRMYLVHHRAEALAHIVNTASQYNLPPLTKKLAYAANRAGIAQQFADRSARLAIESDLELIDHFDQQLRRLELELSRTAKLDDPRSYYLLRSIPGVGKILALVLLYEIHDVRRFAKVGRFLSYARLVKCPHESAGKRLGTGGKKIGNAHLKWAFSEATLLLMRQLPAAKEYVDVLAKKHGKGKALSILSARLGRTVYLMLRRYEPFNAQRFLKT